MKKIVLAITAVTVFCLTASLLPSGGSSDAIDCAVAEQTILRLMSDPVQDAVETYYSGPRGIWKRQLLSVQKSSVPSRFEVVIRVETFYGPHNPPWALDTMTFQVDYGGRTELEKFDHQAESDESP